MKSLLILGAGQFGQVTYEIAESLEYKKIGFLDDHAAKAIGKLDEFEKFKAKHYHELGEKIDEVKA